MSSQTLHSDFADRMKISRALESALNKQNPGVYPQLVADLCIYSTITPNHVVAWLFDPQNSDFYRLFNNKSRSAAGTSRDSRLLAWLCACESNGASVSDVFDPNQQINPRKGVEILLRFNAMDTLKWLRERGIERILYFYEDPTTSTTVASMASYLGLWEQTQSLLPGSALTHPHILWPRLWEKDVIDTSFGLSNVLLTQGPVADNFITAIARSAINVKNTQTVIGLAQRMITEHGAQFTAEQATQCLLETVEFTRSPASLDLVDFCLSHGADPLPAFQVALNTWIQSSLTSSLRPIHRQCVQVLFTACGSSQVAAVLSPEYVQDLATQIQMAQDRVVSGAHRASDLAQVDIAWVRKMALDCMTAPSIDARSSSRRKSMF